MLDLLSLNPLPVFRAPPPRIGIPTCIDELEKPIVGDAVTLDRETRDFAHVERKLVVPAETNLLPIGSENHAPGRNVHPSGSHPAPVDARLVAGRPPFLFERK